MATSPPAATSSGPRSVARRVRPASRAFPHTPAAFSGMKRKGNQPLATSAVISTFFGPIEATHTGMASRSGWVMSFNGFPSPVPRPGGRGMG